MTRVITRAAGLAAATALFVTSALPTFSADSAIVNANVSVLSPCLSITFVNNLTGLDFGALTFGGLESGFEGFFSIVNCASAPENVSARGTDATSATSTASWALQESPRSCPAFVNQYALETRLSASSPPSVLLSKTDKLLVAGVAPGSHDVNVALLMPCSGSVGAGETMNFQLIYTAAL